VTEIEGGERNPPFDVMERLAQRALPQPLRVAFRMSRNLNYTDVSARTLFRYCDKRQRMRVASASHSCLVRDVGRWGALGCCRRSPFRDAVSSSLRFVIWACFDGIQLLSADMPNTLYFCRLLTSHTRRCRRGSHMTRGHCSEVRLSKTTSCFSQSSQSSTRACRQLSPTWKRISASMFRSEGAVSAAAKRAASQWQPDGAGKCR